MSSDSKNSLLVYTQARSVESIRNTLLLGIDRGSIQGFIEKKLDDNDPEWKLYNTKIMYFEPSHTQDRAPLQMKHQLSILRHAGRMCGLYPKNDPNLALTIDDSLDMLLNFRLKFNTEKNSGEADKQLCEVMQHFENLIQENQRTNGERLVVGKHITIIDLELAATVGWCGGQKFVDRGCFDRNAFKEEFPNVRAIRTMINDHPYLTAANNRHQVHYALCKAGQGTFGEAHSFDYIQKLRRRN